MFANTGMAMMLKAVGIDPAEIVQKGEQLEAMLRALATEVQTRVTSMDERSARMEALLMLTLAKVEQQGGPTRAAGASADVVPYHRPPTQTNEGAHNNGRNTRAGTADRRSRKAG